MKTRLCRQGKLTIRTGNLLIPLEQNCETCGGYGTEQDYVYGAWKDKTCRRCNGKVIQLSDAGRTILELVQKYLIL